MRKRILLTGFVFALACLPLAAQTLVLNTGDTRLDITLSSLNVEARSDVGSFTAELSVSYQVKQVEIQRWITVERLQPAEVYLVLELGRISQKPPATVIEVYRANKGKGWGAIARALGIKPGSREFKALKASTDDRYGKTKNRKKD